MLFSFASKLLLLLLAGEFGLVLAPVGAAVAVTALVGVHYRLTAAVERVRVAWLVVPAIFPLYSLAALKALLEYVFT